MFAQWRERVGASATLRRLLALLLPAGRRHVGPCLGELLQQTGWAELACHQGLAAAFSVFLRRGGFWNGLSPVSQERLDAAYRENLANWLLRERVLHELVECFRHIGKSPVLLKGLAFASELYPEPAARLAGDIDLLIAPGWKQEVHEQLQRAGFHLLSQPATAAARSKSLLRRTGWFRRSSAVSASDDEGESVYLIRIGGEDVLVEIHCHLINLRAGGGKEQVFRSREDALPATRLLSLAGGEIRVLNHATSFVHALRHLALHHRLIGFRWHLDLALMLVQWEDDLDPIHIRNQCRELNSEKVLTVELAILAELFGPRVLPNGGQDHWQSGVLPWEYPLYRHVARGGKRTPWRELVRTFLAPGLRQQLQTLR